MLHVATHKKTTQRVLLAAGGTGGHIVPGIALAQEFHRQGKNISFLSLKKNRDYGELRELKGSASLHFYDAPPLPQKKSPLSFLSFPARFFHALLRASFLLIKKRIDLVVGMGGYPMIPALLAACLLRRPYVLCEQNAVAGLGTRLFARGARALFLNFPLSHELKGLEPSMIHQKGNPLRSQILRFYKSQREGNSLSFHESKKESPLKRDGELHVLVLGGSQGALQINRILLQIVPRLSEDFHWTLQCGSSHFKEMSEALSPYDHLHLKLIPYSPSTELGKLYTQADILFCRAGAGVLSEALCFALPLVLLPYPYAADLHQEANAAYLEENGAALVSRQKDTRIEPLLKILKELKEKPQKRRAMSEAALSLALPHASADIAQFILS